eukprot:snap_masked-scaffold_3-processed-gene-2.31-mRNA-1 protein AED:1.00 eAED:1.00 QI:0/0/0/0/1/1/2/0/380
MIKASAKMRGVDNTCYKISSSDKKNIILNFQTLYTQAREFCKDAGKKDTIETITLRNIEELSEEELESINFIFENLPLLKNFNFIQCSLDVASIEYIFSKLQLLNNEIRINISEPKDLEETETMLMNNIISNSKVMNLKLEMLLTQRTCAKYIRNQSFNADTSLKELALDSSPPPHDITTFFQKNKVLKDLYPTIFMFHTFFKFFSSTSLNTKYSQLLNLKLFNADKDSHRQTKLATYLFQSNLKNTLKTFVYDSVDCSLASWAQISQFILSSASLEEIHIGSPSFLLPTIFTRFQTKRPAHRSMKTNFPSSIVPLFLTGFSALNLTFCTLYFMHIPGVEINAKIDRFKKLQKDESWTTLHWHNPFSSQLLNEQFIIYKA